MTPEQVETYGGLRELERRASRADGFHLAKYLVGRHWLNPENSGQKDLWGPWHRELFDWLWGLWLTRHSRPYKTFAVVCWPRRTMKSTICTGPFPIEVLLHRANTRVLFDSQDEDSSMGFLAPVKQVFEDKLFQEIHGDIRDKSNWNMHGITVLRDAILPQGSIEVGSAESSPTGQHYELIIADDLQTEKNVKEPAQRKKIIDRVKMYDNLLDQSGMAVIVGTRWDNNDLMNFLQVTANEDERYSRPQRIFFNKKHAYKRMPDGKLSTTELEFPGLLTEAELSFARSQMGRELYSCNPAGTPIMLADLSTKPIEDVKIGDELVGFTFGNGDCKLAKSKVLRTGQRISDVVKITLDNGDVIRCTPDHKWFTGRSGVGSHKSYNRAKVGRKLVQVFDLNYRPTQDQIGDWRYLAGLADGEGSCAGSTLIISQSTTVNPEICQAIRDVAVRLGVDCREYSPKGARCHQFAFNGGKVFKQRLLTYGKPGKRRVILESVWNRPGRIPIAHPRPIRIEPDGKEMVYSFETTTGNYVAWGYASKNCNYLCEPFQSENAQFHKEWIQHHEMTMDQLPEGSVIYMAVDPAGEGKFRDADFNAIVVAAVTPQNDTYVLLAWHGHVSRLKLLEKIMEIHGAFNPRKIGVEAVFGQHELKNWMKDQLRQRGKIFNWHDFTNSTEKKEARIRVLLPLAESRKLFIRKDMIDLESEMLNWAGSDAGSGHDDLLDAFAYIRDMVDIVFEDKQMTPYWATTDYLLPEAKVPFKASTEMPKPPDPTSVAVWQHERTMKEMQTSRVRRRFSPASRYM